MNKSISSISDYSALKKLASALWRQNDSYHGAAIMIGAGFSRCAAISGDNTKKLPLWNDFSKILQNELDSSSHDPLQLAEEYCTYFGRQNLDDLIKKELKNDAWSSGSLHFEVLELPWSEVLTTNWDTLLERTATQIPFPIYSIVSKPEDLSSAKSPRIAKFHGTIGVTSDLIFTGQDYREYPQKYAPFVNFARQVFIENELCLLGFSGDDPNFEKWAGWVRDNLGQHSRRIYLVGALNLSSAKRKHLESKNISPIDLYSLVEDHDDHDLKHTEATRIFLQALKDLKPESLWDWQPRIFSYEERYEKIKDPVQAIKHLEEHVSFLQKDRQSHPGWLITPSTKRMDLEDQQNHFWSFHKIIPSIPSENKAKFLYEISWRYQLTFHVIPEWLVNELFCIFRDEKSILSKKQQMEIAFLLLNNSRWVDDDSDELNKNVVIEFLEENKKYWLDSINEQNYYYAIVARDELNYSALEMHAKQISEEAPIWKIRKASLFAEIGLFQEGEQLVKMAYKELLLQHRNDQNSIQILSHLAWAHFLQMTIERSHSNKSTNSISLRYKEALCEPWDHIEKIRGSIDEELDKQQKKTEALFEAGTYKDHGNTIYLNEGLHPVLLIDGITNNAGLPLYWNGISILGSTVAKLVELNNFPGRFSYAIRSAFDNKSAVINRVFSRISIALLQEDEITYLLNLCKQSIEFWLTKCEEKNTLGYAHRRLRVFIEIMARVSVRVDSCKAKEIFLFAISLGKRKELQYVWSGEPLNNLLNYVLECVSKEEHQEILFDALSFPLKSETNLPKHAQWPNPLIHEINTNQLDEALNQRLNEIINTIEPNSKENDKALLRLFPFIEHNLLSKSMLERLKTNIWGNNFDFKSLPQTGLFSFALFLLPTPSGFNVREYVKNYLFEAPKDQLVKKGLLAEIFNIARKKTIKEFPSEKQASRYFKMLTSWRMIKEENDFFRITEQEQNDTARLIAYVLAYSVVPSLNSNELTAKNFEKLTAFYTETKTNQVLIAFCYFAAKDETFATKQEKFIREGFQSGHTENLVIYASHALLTWRKLQSSSAIDKLITRLVYLIHPNQKNDLSALIGVVEELCRQDYLTSEHLEILADILPIIFDHHAYESIFISDKSITYASLVRAACVKLTREIMNKSSTNASELERLIRDAKFDQLPEVRFA